MNRSIHLPEPRSPSLDRRQFLTGLSGLAGIAAASCLLPQASAKAQLVAADDPRLHTEKVHYPGHAGEVLAYLARPRDDQKRPAVVVIHENRGLTPHIQDVARRLALEGFMALAPDALSPLGGTPTDADKAREMIGQLDGPSTTKNFVAAVQYLKTHPLSTGKAGCTGFCWGGAMTNQVAVNCPDLIAAVPYYGMQPALEDVPKIKASLLLHYAGEDERIDKGIPAFEEALKKASVEYQIYVYPGAKHAFNNDTSPSQYNKEAADQAWKRTIEFFKAKLRT
jgi:carboxymethylenebutenolidase